MKEEETNMKSTSYPSKKNYPECKESKNAPANKSFSS